MNRRQVLPLLLLLVASCALKVVHRNGVGCTQQKAAEGGFEANSELVLVALNAC
jgi:hypothetical protein